MDRVYIKEKAKEIMRRNHWLCVGAAFLGGLSLGAPKFSVNVDNPADLRDTYEIAFEEIADLFSWHLLPMFILIFFLSLAVTFAIHAFISNQLHVGSCRFFLKFRKNNPVSISEIFQSYKDKTFLNIAKITTIRSIYVTLWSFLFVIPGIIKMHEYWAVDYILSVRPDIDQRSAFDISKRVMNGHKMDLFILNLSFYGWLIVSAFGCMLPYYLYVLPYMRIAQTEFFSEIRKEAISNGIINEYDIPDYMDYTSTPPYGYYQNTYTQNPYVQNPYTPPFINTNTNTNSYQQNGYYPQQTTIPQQENYQPGNSTPTYSCNCTIPNAPTPDISTQPDENHNIQNTEQPVIDTNTQGDEIE